MSSSIWTRGALSSNRRPARGICWRVVEAQHFVSTAKLTDSAAEQTRLEEIIEAGKPAVLAECRHLHFLLFTPFRYGAPYPAGSRFRRAGLTPGVFYASVRSKTAVIEAAFHRLLFYAESPDTAWPREPGEYSAFAAAYATGRALDLTRPPFAKHAEVWVHPTALAPCQQLAEDARAENIDLIKYRSARDADGVNLALLSCRAFAKPEPVDRETWRIQLGAGGVRAICEFPKSILSFDRAAFARDPRIAAMRWER